MAARIRSVSLGLLAGIVCTCVFSQAATTRPGDFTERDYRKAVFDFNRRTLGDAYKTVGQRDPKWDEPAQKLLDGIAVYFTNAGADGKYRVPGVVPTEELIAAGKAAIDAGCGDPQVLYCYGALLDDTNKDSEAMPFLRQAIEKFPQSHYPINRAFNAATRMVKHAMSSTSPDAAKRDEYNKLAHDFALASMALGDFKGLDRRVMLFQIFEWLDTQPGEVQLQFYKDALEIGQCDPWMLNMVGGHAEYDAGWSARGNGFSSTVTDEGWAGFEKHQKEAEKLYRKAYELEPKFPESSMQLIRVTMGRSDPKAMRQWFDRAIAAQIDYLPAYSSLRWALRPRWYGSEDYRELTDLAEQCRKGGRYDTDVPYEAIRIFWDIAQDSGSLDIWRDDRVRDITDVVTRHYADGVKNAKSKRNYLSVATAMYWYRGEHQAAKKLLDEMGGEMEPNPIRGFHMQTWRIKDQVYASTCSYGADIIAAESKALDDPAGALSAYQAIAKKTTGTDPARRFLFYRTKELIWQDKFQKGEWVPIMPGPPGPPDCGWEPIYGNWTREKDGSLLGKGSGARMVMLCTAEFGKRYELSGTVELDPSQTTAESNGGPIVGWLSETEHYGMWLRLQTQVAVMKRLTYFTKAWPAEVKEKNDFTIQVWDEMVAGNVNNKPVFTDFNMNSAITGGANDARIGVGSQYVAKDGTIRFRDLKIRKLRLPPPILTTQPSTRPSGMRRLATTQTH